MPGSKAYHGHGRPGSLAGPCGHMRSMRARSTCTAMPATAYPCVDPTARCCPEHPASLQMAGGLGSERRPVEHERASRSERGRRSPRPMRAVHSMRPATCTAMHLHRPHVLYCKSAMPCPAPCAQLHAAATSSGVSGAPAIGSHCLEPTVFCLSMTICW